MKNKLLLFLGIFIFMFIPKNVFADTSGSYALDRTTYIHYNVEDKTDYYLSTLKTNTIVGGSGSPFYMFYQGLVGVIHTNNNKTYTPAFFQFSNSNGSMNLCDNQCDLMISFDYGLLGRDTPFTPIYMQAFRRASTGFSGVKLIGTDINDEYKEFYCTGQYLISGTGTLDYPWSKFIATCPTSNFKSISRVQVSTGFGSVPNTTEFFDVTYFIESMHYTISAYTGTQDGIGGSVSDDSEPTEEEILQELEYLINMDLDNNDKAPPNTDDYDDYVDAEQDLFDQMDEADIDDMQIAIDVNSSTWVWDRITSWLSTNALLSSFLISMLSIGIIKMALGR